MKAIHRLHKYLKYRGIKPASYEKIIGVSNGYLGTQQRRDGDLGESVINKIIDNSLELSLLWLLRGEGDMLHTPTSFSTPVIPESPTPHITSREDGNDNIVILLRDMLREKDELLARQQEEIGKLKAELAQAQAKLDELDYLNDDDAPDIGMPPSVLAG